jgi:fatty-acyl-CoA synthase
MLLADLERHARERGARPCLVHWDDGRYHVLTFAQFAEISDRLATAVRSQAKVGSQVVLLILKHHVLQLPLFVGCMKAGLIPCFLPFPSVKQDRVLYWKTHEEVINRSRPALIVTYGELVAGVSAIATNCGAPIADIATLEEALASSDHHPPCRPREDDIALLQHSSGTTGLKKGVALSYGQIARQIAAYAPAAVLDSASTIVNWLPYYHDMGLFTAFLMPLLIGATVISMDAFDWVSQPELVLDLFERFRATHCWLPNFAFSHIVNTTSVDRDYDLKSLRAIINCSEPVKPLTFAGFVDRFESCGITRSKLKACYAMAETCFAVSQTSSEADYEVRWYDAQLLDREARAGQRPAKSAGARPYVSNGAPIAGIEVRILSGLSVPRRDIGLPVGEIAVRGTFVFKGYFANDEATSAAFQGDWYCTGDVGFIDEGGVFICGRKKDLLIVHGRNYYAHDIEAAASSIAEIIPGRIVAIGVFDDEVGSEEAVILAETYAPAQAHKALRREVKRRVYGALELTPQKVDFVPHGWLVKTTSGKISRSENLTRYLARTAAKELA